MTSKAMDVIVLKGTFVLDKTFATKPFFDRLLARLARPESGLRRFETPTPFPYGAMKYPELAKKLLVLETPLDPLCLEFLRMCPNLEVLKIVGFRGGRLIEELSTVLLGPWLPKLVEIEFYLEELKEIDVKILANALKQRQPVYPDSPLILSILGKSLPEILLSSGRDSISAASEYLLGRCEDTLRLSAWGIAYSIVYSSMNPSKAFHFFYPAGFCSVPAMEALKYIISTVEIRLSSGRDYPAPIIEWLYDVFTTSLSGPEYLQQILSFTANFTCHSGRGINVSRWTAPQHQLHERWLTLVRELVKPQFNELVEIIVGADQNRARCFLAALLEDREWAAAVTPPDGLFGKLANPCGNC
jgi:hypothetical protein